MHPRNRGLSAPADMCAPTREQDLPMRSIRALGAGAATATLVLLLAACNGTDSSAGDQSTRSANSAAPSKVAPKAPSKTAEPTAPSTSGQPTASSDSHFSSDEVCYKFSAQHLHDLLGLKDDQKVTPTDMTTNSKSSDPLYVRDPSLCTYKLPPVDSNTLGIGVGTGSYASASWAAIKGRNKARFRNDLGGDEAADLGDGMYLVHKGDKLISVQGIMSGLSTTDLEKVTREAANIL